MNQEKLSRIIIDWKTEEINPEQAMQRVHRLNNLESTAPTERKKK